MTRHLPASGLGLSLVLSAAVIAATLPTAGSARLAPLRAAPRISPLVLPIAVNQGSVFADEPTLLEGLFAVLHVDSHSTGGYERQYALIRADGTEVPLAVDEAWLESAGGYRRLEGEEVVVSVAPPDGAVVAAGEPALQLTGVQLVGGEPPLDDPHAGDPGAQFRPAESLAYANLLCRFPDVSAAPPSPDTIAGWFTNNVDGPTKYYNEASYGRLQISFTTATAWKTLPFRFADFSTSLARINAITQACPALFADEIDLGLYDGVQFLTNADWGSSVGSVRWPIPYHGSTRYMATTWLSWFFGSQYAHGIITHELGHSLGEPHSTSEATTSAYDNLWDVMSGHACGAGGNPSFGGCLAQGMIADHKLNQGWLLPNRIFTLSGSADATVNLDWLTAPGSSSNPLVITIPIGPGHYFTVEARRKDGVSFDRALRGTGIILHEVKRTGRPEPAWQVSALRTAASDAPPAVWLPGESYVNHLHQFAVQVLAESTAGYRVRLLRGAAVPATGPALALNLAAAPLPGQIVITGGVLNSGSSLGHGIGLELRTVAAPPGGTLSLVSATGADCRGASSDEGGIWCTLPAVAAGGSAAFTLVLRPLANGAYTLEGALFGNSTEVETGDNLNQVSFTAVAAADLVAAIEPVFVSLEGSQVTPRIWFTNTGAAAQGVMLEVGWPSGFRPTKIWTLSSTPGLSCQWTETSRRCSLAQMPAGAYVRFDLTLARDGADDGSHLVRASAWASSAGEIDTTNNNAGGVICLGACTPPTPTPTPTPVATPTPVPVSILPQPTPSGPLATPAAPFVPVMSVYLPTCENGGD